MLKFMFRRQEQCLSFFFPVERQMWSPRSFYHHLNGFSSIPSNGEQGSIHHLLYFNVLCPFDSNNTRENLCETFVKCRRWWFSSIKNWNFHLNFFIIKMKNTYLLSFITLHDLTWWESVLILWRHKMCDKFQSKPKRRRKK